MKRTMYLRRSLISKALQYTRVCAGAVALLIAAGCDPAMAPIIQTGLRVDDDIVVTLDNPDFTEVNVKLTPAKTKWNGLMSRTIDVTGQGFTVGNGDFEVRTWRGDGSASSTGVSTFASVGNEDLPARPDAEGHYASNQPPEVVALQAHGLRVGFTPLLVQLFQLEPDRSTPVSFSASRVRLDPSVALVPIQVVVVFHDKDAQGRLTAMEQQRLPEQLLLWDHLPTVQTTNVTDGQFGELTLVIHAMPWLRRNGDGQYTVGTQKAPDTVWDRCGVQFRLVNYFELQVPTRNVSPARGNADRDPERLWPERTLNDSPLRDNLARARLDPRYIDGTVTVIFMLRVGFEDSPEAGRYLTGLGAIGVSLTDGSGTDGVIAHELGHISGLGDATGTERDAAGKPMYNVMIGVGAGVEPTDAECKRFKPWADTFKIFWTQPHGNR